MTCSTRMTPAIVPRWEWRTFGERFGSAADRLAAEEPEAVQESKELYFLSPGSGDTVKVRGGLMDVKHLEQVDENGLEQWLPVLKTGFPLDADAVRSVLTSLRCVAPVLERAEYTLAQLLDEIVGPSPALRALEVHKRRTRTTIGGCSAELTEVRADGASTRTIAVEQEDPDRVIAAVRELGLDSRSNTSYPRGLKALVGFGAGRYAVLDIGTNSVNVHIAERSVDGAWRTVADRAEVTRLGEGLDDGGRLTATAIGRTVDAVAAMVDEARDADVLAIVAVGTAGLRIASNSAEFVEAVRDRCGITVEVIPGEEEARLAYLAATASLGLDRGALVVFDTGGGSSQFTFGRGRIIEDRFSVNVGAARITERFGLDRAVSESVLATALQAIGSDLARLDGRPAPDALVGMGGAVTNLAAVSHGLATYDPDVVQGTMLDRAEIDRQIELYRERDADERREIVGLQPKRAEVILAGSCIVRTVLAMLDAESLTVSDRGLRHGVLVERFS